MSHRLAILLVLLLPSLARAADESRINTLTPKEIADGWILLFDGQSLTGWTSPTGAKWHVYRGLLYPDAASADPTLVTTTAFADYELSLEYRMRGAAAIGLGYKRDGTTEKESQSYNLHGGDSAWWRATVQVSNGNIGSIGMTSLDGRAAVKSASAKEPPRAPYGHIALLRGGIAYRNIKLRPLGTTSLFNGKDLSGWKVHKGEKYSSKFEVSKNGVLTVKDGPGDLQTEGRWDNFVLQLECKTNGKLLNSGVFFRCREGEYQQGYEAQIHNGFDPARPKEYSVEVYDPESGAVKDKRQVASPALDYGTGAIYRRLPVTRQLAQDKEWFTMTVIADGRHIATWVNGVPAIDWTDNRLLKDNARQGCCLNKGHISLQGHDPTTDLSFRKLRLAELRRQGE